MIIGSAPCYFFPTSTALPRGAGLAVDGDR